MARIHVLPDALANQIAAGEVVERPASVVKEGLVENALDAEASRVVVEVADGGRALVRIVDDGTGMPPDDAALALKRHATSKLRTSEDLHAIATLGFRGEALPSIASVSRFRLVTRDEEALAATEISVEGGGEPTVREVAGPVGTCIEVRDLFYNVPARLKFLKTRATEMGHIHALVAAFALGNPHVHLRLLRDGKVGADHPIAKRLEQRVFQVLGKAVSKRLQEVRLDGPIRVLGYLSEPGYVRANPQGVYLFVNGRRVRDRTISHALMSAYGAALERGRFPYAVLYVHLPPDEVDVNVHPTKAEVRFAEAGRVHEAVSRACRQSLVQRPWRASGARSAIGPSQQSLYEVGRATREVLRERSRDYAPTSPRGPRPNAETPPRRSQALRFVETPTVPPVGELAPAGDMGTPAPPPAPAPTPAPPPNGNAAAATAGRFASWRVVGQLGQRWIITEDLDRRRLHLVDQAAASQAVVRARLAAAAEGGLEVQPLLFPEQMELDADEVSAWSTYGAAIRQLGIGLEPFGGRTWQVIHLPAPLARASPTALVRDALAGARRGTLLESMAAHAPIRAGQTLSEADMRGLVAALGALGIDPDDQAATAGLVFTTSFDDIDRRLGRREAAAAGPTARDRRAHGRR